MNHIMTLALITACAATCVQAAPETKKPKGETLEQYLAAKKKLADKKGWNYEKSLPNMKKTFSEIDANKDGIITGTEKTAYWKKKES